MKKLVTAAIAVAMPLAPATAATCWKTATVEAAQVRHLEMMLMVSALRCRGTNNNFLPAYNRFVQEKRAALTEVNEELRSHFRSEAGPVAGLDAYDDYVTALANSFGSGTEGLGCRDLQSIADAANALAPTRSALLELADAAAVVPRMAGLRCDTVITIAAEPTTGKTTVSGVLFAQGPVVPTPVAARAVASRGPVD